MHRAIRKLREEHRSISAVLSGLRELARAVLGYEQSWPQGGAAFRDAVDAYAEFHWRHMRKEEQQLLPLAEKRLTPADWTAIEQAFLANEDPLAGAAEHDCQRLFRRIAEIAPAPVGLGTSWRPVQ